MSNNIFIECHACHAHNASDADQCSECQSDLLPGTSLRRRLLWGVVGIIGLAIFFFLIRFVFMAPGPVIFVSTFPGLLALVSFRLALATTTLTDRYWHRAMRHMECCPDQAILDFTRGIEASPNEAYRMEILERRGDALLQLGRYGDAINDYELCLKTLESGSEKDYVRVRNKKIDATSKQRKQNESL